jgi:hypothetical protein
MLYDYGRNVQIGYEILREPAIIQLLVDEIGMNKKKCIRQKASLHWPADLI